MIITVVCDVLGEENNGTTIAGMNLIRYLKAQGHTVRVLCGDQDKIGLEDYYIVPNYNLGKILNDYVDKVGVTLAKPEMDIVEEALKGVDAVHILIPLSLGIAACKIARRDNIPITASFHMQAENFTCYLKLNKVKPVNKFVYYFIWKHLYQYADAIHYPTSFIREIFEKSIKRTTNGYVISNGVHSYVRKKDIPKPKGMESNIVILATGRYAREKSQDTLLKAVALSKYKNKIQLILAGQGIKEKYYRKLAKKLPVSPIFKFYSREEMIDVLNYCDFYVHPAEIELEGISCIEAISCGKLTILSNSKLSATRNFAVDEKCVFKSRSPKSLAKTIDYWIDHPEEKRVCEEKYLNSAKVFNQDLCMKRMEKMLLEVVDGKRTKENSLL